MFQRISSLLTLLVCCCSLSTAGVALSGEAKHRGEQGLRISSGSAPFEIIADSAEPLQRLRVRFYLRVRDLELSEGGTVTVLQGDGSQPGCLAVMVGRVDGALRLGWSAAVDGGAMQQVSPSQGPSLSATWQALELAWSADAGGGSLQLWLNDVPLTSLSDFSNSSCLITALRLGLPGAAPGSFSGFLDIDSFVWRDRGEIGTLSFDPVQIIAYTAAWPAGHSVLFLTGLVGEASSSVSKTSAGARLPTSETEKDGFHEH